MLWDCELTVALGLLEGSYSAVEKEEIEALAFIAWLVSHTSQAAEKAQSPGRAGANGMHCSAAQRKALSAGEAPSSPWTNLMCRLID